MDKMAKTIAAALRVLNPAGLEPSAPAKDALQDPRNNRSKHPDSNDNFPPRAT